MLTKHVEWRRSPAGQLVDEQHPGVRTHLAHGKVGAVRCMRQSCRQLPHRDQRALLRAQTPCMPRPAVLTCFAQVFVQGLDRQGRPIVLGVGHKHKKFENKEAALTFCKYALDAAVMVGNTNPNWDGKFTGVFDLRSKARVASAGRVAVVTCTDAMPSALVGALHPPKANESPLPPRPVPQTWGSRTRTSRRCPPCSSCCRTTTPSG
jgi:hypothetical protein